MKTKKLDKIVTLIISIGMFLAVVGGYYAYLVTK